MASTQQSSVKILMMNKPKLVRWLSKDFQCILQYVQCAELVDDRVYQRLKSTELPERACIDLIDTVMNRGEGPSYAFLELLKDPEVHGTYAEQLGSWILSMELSPPAGQTTPQKTNTSDSAAGQPTPQNCSTGQPQIANISHSVADKELFFMNNRSKLVANVKNVGPILDDLRCGGIHAEMAASAHADNTANASVRRILDAATSSRAREALFNALLKHEAGVMEDLLHG